MASSTCWKCLSRLGKPSTTPSLARASAVSSSNFSTSATTYAAAAKPGSSKQANAAKKSQKLKLNVSKGKGTPAKANYKRPAPGERKAIRKRIVLSNTNALEVPSVVDLEASNFANEDLLGQMGGLSAETIDSLRTIEAFKPSQGWGFFHRPAALVREETLELAKAINAGGSGSNEIRRILAGERGSGKSVLLLQAQAMAFLKGWVVIHLPEAIDLTSATTAYEPITGTDPIQYAQRQYVADLLSRIGKANARVLREMTLQKEYKFSKPVQANISLDRLCEFGADDLSLSWEVFNALFSELSAEGAPPILYSVDGLAHFSRFTEYLKPSMHYIHPHELALVNHFIGYLSGATALPNGGMVLAADSCSNRYASPTLDFVISAGQLLGGTPPQGSDKQEQIEQYKAMIAAKGDPSVVLADPSNPYRDLDQRTLHTLLGVQVKTMAGLSRDEARAVLEYYAKSGMLRTTINDALVAEKWATSGGGIVGELERGSVRRGLY